MMRKVPSPKGGACGVHTSSQDPASLDRPIRCKNAAVEPRGARAQATGRT